MPDPGGGGSRPGRGLYWGRGGRLRLSEEWGGREDEALPHPAPPRGGGGHGAAGPNPGQKGRGAPVAVTSAAASAAAAPANAGAAAAAAGLILRRLKAAAAALRTRPAAALRHAAVRALVPPPAPGGVGGPGCAPFPPAVLLFLGPR